MGGQFCVWKARMETNGIRKGELVLIRQIWDQEDMSLLQYMNELLYNLNNSIELELLLQDFKLDFLFLYGQDLINLISSVYVGLFQKPQNLRLVIFGNVMSQRNCFSPVNYSVQSSSYMFTLYQSNLCYFIFFCFAFPVEYQCLWISKNSFITKDVKQLSCKAWK